MRALHHLFEARRNLATPFYALSAVPLLGVLVINSVGKLGNSSGDVTPLVFGAIISGVLLTGGIILSSDFSEDKEAEIVAAFQQEKPLPAEIRRSLKARFFR
ncbi:MAG: hypothetical protein NVS3B25_27280 [Hymenobacter sp.]